MKEYQVINLEKRNNCLQVIHYLYLQLLWKAFFQLRSLLLTNKFHYLVSIFLQYVLFFLKQLSFIF